MKGGVQEWFGTLARLLVGGVWLVAGAIKVPNGAESVRAVRAYRILPEAIVPTVGHVLPAVEIVVGLALVVGVLTRVMAIVSALLAILNESRLCRAAANCWQTGGRLVGAIDRRTNIGLTGALALRDHDGQRLPLNALEVLERPVDGVGTGARSRKAPAGQVLGLTRGKGKGGDKHHDPHPEHEPPPTLEKRGEAIHRRLHEPSSMSQGLSGWPAKQLSKPDWSEPGPQEV